MANSSSSMNTSTAVLIRVDQSGHGDYTKIQDAIDAVPDNNSEFVFIWVKPGTYREKIVVPANKPYITISGSKTADNTIIIWNQTGEIFESPAVSVLASDFVGRYLTIQNNAGEKVKAVALRVSGDRAAFYACKILGYQDTLLDDMGRHYYKNCYIQGAIDFIFGDAASLFEVPACSLKCHLHYSSEETAGAITAHRRESPSEDTGFVFLGCKITGEGTGKVYLGRPWGDHSRVVFALTYMPTAVMPQGWDDWHNPAAQKTVYYGEYKCYGPGASKSDRVTWSRALTTEEAEPFLTKDMIGGSGWLRPTPATFKKGFSKHA
ncbi:hypothetical protein V2J09_016701 [Rumex salicifolius]